MSLKKNVIANYLGNGWTALMSLAFIPIYIKYLGMEAYGLIGLYAVLQSSLTLIDAGMTPTLSREMSRFTAGAHSALSIRDLLRSLEVLCFSTASLYGVLVWAGANWLSTNWLRVEKLGLSTVATAVSIMGIVTALKLIEGLYRGAIIGLQKQVLFNIVNAILATLRSFGAVLILALVSPTIYAYFAWQAAISMIAVSALATIVYTHLPKAERSGQFSRTELTKIWRFAVGVFATGFLVLLLTQVDKLILSKILPLEAFGQYSLAAAIANSLLMLASPITQAYYPRLTETLSAGNIEELKMIYHRGAQLITVITGTAACIIFCFGEILIIIWTGSEELAQSIGNLLKIMTLGTLFNSFMNTPYVLQLAFGWSSFGAKVNFVAVMFLVPAVLLVTPIYGAIGAAWIWVILNAGYLFISSYFMHKVILITEKTKWLLRDLFIPFLATASTILLIWLLRPVFTSTTLAITFIVATGLAGTSAGLIASSEVRRLIVAKKPCY